MLSRAQFPRRYRSEPRDRIELRPRCSQGYINRRCNSHCPGIPVPIIVLPKALPSLLLYPEGPLLLPGAHNLTRLNIVNRTRVPRCAFLGGVLSAGFSALASATDDSL